MGLMDKAKQAVQGRSEKIERGVDQAAKMVDKRTGGKYRDKLNKGAEQVKSRARSFDEQRRMERGDGVVEPGGTTGTGPSTGTGTSTAAGPSSASEHPGATEPPQGQPGSPGL